MGGNGRFDGDDLHQRTDHANGRALDTTDRSPHHQAILAEAFRDATHGLVGGAVGLEPPTAALDVEESDVSFDHEYRVVGAGGASWEAHPSMPPARAKEKAM